MAVSLFSATAYAQVVTPVPNPGTISTESQRVQQEVAKRSETRIDGPAVVGPKVPEQLVVPPGGTTFLLKEVTFDHSVFVSDAELAEIASRFVGKRVDISGLQLLVKSVNDILAQRRIITALAYLPQQNLNSGKLHVAIVEGRLGQVVVKGNRLLPTEWATSTVTTAPGAVVDVPKVEHDVALFNLSNNAQIQASLQPGGSFGLTDITLSVLEPPVNSLQVFFDNQGVNSVGKLEGGVNYQRYGLVGIDDKFSMYALGSQGNQNGNIAYNLPFNRLGGRIGVSAGFGQIRVVQGPYTSLNIKGTSDNEAVNLSQPVYVDPTWALLLNGSLGRAQSASTQTGVEITNNETLKQTVGTTLRYTDPNFVISLSPNISFAQTSMNVTATKETFSLFTATLSGTGRLPLDFLVTLNGNGQLASRSTLPGDQQFQVGGPSTVRGYSPDSASGTDGYYTNLELHHSLAGFIDRTDVFSFYDRGVVYNTFPKAVTLNSFGTGLSWQAEKYVAADVSIGFPVTKIASREPAYTVYFRLTAKLP